MVGLNIDLYLVLSSLPIWLLWTPVLSWWLYWTWRDVYVQFLFESRNDVTVMPCGHTIHLNCLKEMQEHCQWASRTHLLFQISLSVNSILNQTKLLAGTLALYAQSRFVICPKSGRNLMRRLLPLRCLIHIRIRWFSNCLCSYNSDGVYHKLRVHKMLSIIYFISTGADTMQWLREDISSAVPCRGSEVRALQVI